MNDSLFVVRVFFKYFSFFFCFSCHFCLFDFVHCLSWHANYILRWWFSCSMKRSMNLFYIINDDKNSNTKLSFGFVVVLSIKFIRRSISTAIKHTHRHTLEANEDNENAFIRIAICRWFVIVGFCLIHCGHINIQVKFNSNELIIRVWNNWGKFHSIADFPHCFIFFFTFFSFITFSLY